MSSSRVTVGPPEPGGVPGPTFDEDEGFAPSDAQRSPLPAMIGEYEVVARLGGGAMAELFLAHKTSQFGFVRRAVLKRVRRSRPDYPQLQEMLLDEARATACFDHPNLVALHDVGETDDGVFLALEYVEGSDLRRVNSKLRARREALPFELAAFITVEVLRGLHHAHIAKDQDGQPLDVVHRDVNPSNVLIARSGHVKLADFGVVRMRERLQQKTEPGLVKGKYAYLAPEYIAGEPCSVQTDIYAAGIMLFELLSGRECFSGKTAYEVMWKIVNKGVPLYRLEREGVPEDLQRIVQRATAMAPERRHPSAQDMANALEAWLMRSGRHATPWVLSVFFHRHDLIPGKLDTSRVTPLAHLGEARSADLASTPPRAHPTRGGSGLHAGAPRVVESSKTPLPPELIELMRQEHGLQTPAAPQQNDSLKATRPNEPVPSERGSTGRFGAARPPPAPAPGVSHPRFPPAEPVPYETKTEPLLSVPAKLEPPPAAPLDPSGVPRAGKLEDLSAAEVMSRLLDAGHTGVVEFRCGLIWKKVKLYQGLPIGVTSNMGMELIGEHLVKSRIVTRDQLHRALQKSERGGRPLTAMLIEDGALERSALEVELGRNLGARLHEVLEWRWGSFELRSEEVKPAEFVPQLDIRALLENARRSRSEETEQQPSEDSGEFDAQRKLERAVDMARSLASSAGKGQIERPWRPDEG